MRIADPAYCEMPVPAAILVLESAFCGRGLDPRGQRAQLDAMQPDEDCARMFKAWKCAEATRRDLEGRGLSRDFMQTRGAPLETKRVDSRTEELESDMQIRAPHPSDTVARAFDRLAHRGDRVLDLLAHPNSDERAQRLQVVGRKVFVGMLSRAVFRPMSHLTLSLCGHLLFALRTSAFRSAMAARHGSEGFSARVRSRPAASDRCRKTSNPRRTSSATQIHRARSALRCFRAVWLCIRRK